MAPSPSSTIEKVALAGPGRPQAGAAGVGPAGSVGFAANQRVLKDGGWVAFGVNPHGPVDHSLPVLCVTDPDGKVWAVLAGFACHCTTRGGEFNKVCGDWAGYFYEAIEHDHPGAR